MQYNVYYSAPIPGNPGANFKEVTQAPAPPSSPQCATGATRSCSKIRNEPSRGTGVPPVGPRSGSLLFRKLRNEPSRNEAVGEG